MTKIAIKDAIIMIGHADPETKIAGWLAIGETVAEARERFKIIRGNAKGGKAKEYQDWLVKQGITPRISAAAVAQSCKLFARKSDLDRNILRSKIPPKWTHPAELLKALRWIDQGLDPAVEDSARRTKLYTKDVNKDGEIKLWSDGQSGSFYHDGIAFGNMMTRLPHMTKSDQLKAVGAFFGASSHTIKAERQADGSIRVFEKVTKNSQVDRAKFDITITFHKGVG